MGHAIGCAVIVFVVGFLSAFLNEGFFYMATAATMTGCIVYELESIRREKRGDNDGQ